MSTSYTFIIFGQLDRCSDVIFQTFHFWNNCQNQHLQNATQYHKDGFEKKSKIPKCWTKIYIYAVTRVKLSANLDKLKAGAFVIERDRLNQRGLSTCQSLSKVIEKVKNRISGPCLKDSYILSEENQEEIPRNRSLLRSSWYNQQHFLLELCSFLLVMFAAFPRRDDIVNAARLPTAMKNVRKLIGMLGTRIAARGGWQGQS